MGGSAWPRWQAPSSSSWRRKGRRSCEASPPLEPFACSEWRHQAGTRFKMGKGRLGSACSCQLNWKITFRLLPRSSNWTQAIVANIIYLRTYPSDCEDKVERPPTSRARQNQHKDFSLSSTCIYSQESTVFVSGENLIPQKLFIIFLCMPSSAWNMLITLPGWHNRQQFWVGMF